MRLPPVCALALVLAMTASMASAQQTRRPAPRTLPQPTVATPAAPGPNVMFRIRMYEVLPEKWPEVARQFRMKPTQQIQAAVYSKQIAAAIDGMQKQQMIHLMSEPEIATVSGYPASLSIDGEAPADDPARGAPGRVAGGRSLPGGRRHGVPLVGLSGGRGARGRPDGGAPSVQGGRHLAARSCNLARDCMYGAMLAP
mgnify:CR=1 FL=1